MILRRTLLSVLGIALIGFTLPTCLNESTSTAEGSLTIPNTMGFGGDDDGILVQFFRVENDSRCPADAQCIRAGEAFVVLRTTVDDGQSQETTLKIEPAGEASFSVDRFTVSILELRPDPPPQDGVRQNEYEIDLRIEE